RADDKRLDLVAFGAEDDAAVDALAQDLQAAGVKLASEPAKLQTPGGGYGFRLFDPDGRVVEVSAGVAPRRTREIDQREAIPVGLNHVVLSSTERKRSETFYQELLGFKLSDWIPFM